MNKFCSIIVLISYFSFIVHKVDLKNVDLPPDTEYSLDIDALESLAVFDLKILQIFRKYISRFSDHPELGPLFSEYVNDAEKSYPAQVSLLDESSPDIEKAKEISQNPISVYSLLYRLGQDLTPILQKLRKVNQGLQHELGIILPTTKDISTVATAILRHQRAYNIPTTDMAVGTFPLAGTTYSNHGADEKIETGARLSPKLCAELGQLALDKKHFDTAITWLHFALRSKLTDKYRVKNSALYETIETKLWEAILTQNLILVNGDTSKKLKTFPVALEFEEPILENLGAALERALKARSEKQQILQKKRWAHFDTERYNFTLDKKEYIDFLHRVFDDVCTGKNLQEESKRSRCFCWYERRRSPYYTIGPMKMEFVSRDPDIVQVYEVIGPKAIEKLERFQKGQFKRGGVVGKRKNDIKSRIDYKLAVESSVFDYMKIDWNSMFIHSEHLFDFSRFNHKLTKYSISGRFLPHVDSLCQKADCIIEQERIANYIVYISDTKIGGFTALPLVGVGVQPVKGSALLFYNLYSDGAVDTMSFHGGCPVLLGYKYKMTQFVLYGSPQQYSCSLQPGQRRQIKVNGRLAS